MWKIDGLSLIAGDQVESEAEGAAAQACGDSMNSYAHPGTHRITLSVLDSVIKS